MKYRVLVPFILAVFVPSTLLADTEKPHILWITSEDNGQELGCYGDKFAVTPNIDALAARGMKFKTCWSNAPVCAPARTTIITGLFTPSAGATSMRSQVPLPDSFSLYPVYLRKAGYYCTNNSKEDYNVNQPGTTWDASNAKAHYKNRTPGQPFFAVFNITTSHESQLRTRPHRAVHDPASVRVPPYHPDTPEVRQDWAQYYDKVTEMDNEVGQRLRELEKEGLADDTIIFYYGDHGSGMPRHKRWLYENSLKVGLVVYFPEKWKHLAPENYQANGTSDRLVSFVDLAPTLLSIAGVKAPAPMQGKAFAGAHALPGPDFLYGYRSRMDERYDLSRCVRDQGFLYIRNYKPHLPQGQYLNYMFQTPTTKVWKERFDAGTLTDLQSAFWKPKAPEELYDIVADPDCVINLAQSPDETHQARLKLLREAHVAWAKEIRDVEFLPEAEMYRRLKGKSPYELARDDKAYPMESILAAAQLASLPQENDTAALAKLFQAKDPAIRYWAAIGCLIRGAPAVMALSQELTAGLDDENPSARIAAAHALATHGTEEQLAAALTLLKTEADPRKSSYLDALEALNAIELLEEKSHSILAEVATLPTKDPKAPVRTEEYIQRLQDRLASKHFAKEKTKFIPELFSPPPR